MFGETNMITFDNILNFLKVFVISSAIMMVLEPTATLIITTFVGLVLIGVFDLINDLRKYNEN